MKPLPKSRPAVKPQTTQESTSRKGAQPSREVYFPNKKTADQNSKANAALVEKNIVTNTIERIRQILEKDPKGIEKAATVLTLWSKNEKRKK